LAFYSHDCSISLRGEIWTHGAGLTPQPFIEMPVIVILIPNVAEKNIGGGKKTII
jgi:hypothetical protein